MIHEVRFFRTSLIAAYRLSTQPRRLPRYVPMFVRSCFFQVFEAPNSYASWCDLYGRAVDVEPMDEQLRAPGGNAYPT
jgi:hypothetical protein